MKKTYKNPTLTVVNIQPARIMVTSLEIKNLNAEKSMGRSSRFSDFDEEEE